MNITELLTNKELFANAAIWLANILYFVGLFPQIWLNYCHKSARGLSDTMLAGYMFGYMLQIVYTFGLNLPVQYKTLVPLGFLGVVVLVGQRFYYHGIAESKYFTLLCAMVWSFTLVTIPFMLFDPKNSAYIVGWIATLVWALYQIPQAAKMYVTRSVAGLSFSFVSIMAFGILIEFFSAIILHLPSPTILNNARGLIAYVVFCLQFLIFRKQ